MPKVTIYHNPRCSKSRQTLELLRTQGVDLEIVEYLKDPPSESILRDLSKKLALAPHEMVRKKECAKLDLAENLSPQQYLKEIAKHPVLLERPIVVCGKRARIGRPPENVLEILD
ncbi:MAG: arsenate reductase (glutaredoxin) [Planctomycetaceae bacterium]|nr:arsenate reductase (glutaredoxin) [Planctomycetaceae bacterium]|tara:strand:- start:9950 stop:10294 length:345 start_codon:yes stop_codon:yes gene_type:complete